MPFRPGDPYDNRIAYRPVRRTDRQRRSFKRSTCGRCSPIARSREIPISVALTPAPRRLITYGIGFSTDTGPRFSFGRNNRRWNDRGHQFGVNAQLSTRHLGGHRQLSVSVRRSAQGVDRLRRGREARGHRKLPRARASRSARGVSCGRGRTGRGRRCSSLLVEDYEIADQVDRSRLLMPGIDWNRDASRTTRFSRGSARVVTCWCAAQPIRWRPTRASSRWSPTGSGSGRCATRARFLVRSQIGTTWKQSLAELPASVRFFAGGDNSVRGYDFDELGPVDADGEVIGGSSLITASIEYEHPLRARWSLAFFVDSGNAFEGGQHRRAHGRRHRRPLAVAARSDPHRSRPPGGRSRPRRLARAHLPGAGPMRWVLRSLLAIGALCALVLVCVTALLWVLGSEQGATWIVGRLTQRTNGAISVGRVEGTLLGGLRLSDVAVRLARDEVDIPTLELSWAVAASLAGDLVLDDVRAGRGAVSALAAARTGAPARQLPARSAVSDRGPSRNPREPDAQCRERNASCLARRARRRHDSPTVG